MMWFQIDVETPALADTRSSVSGVIGDTLVTHIVSIRTTTTKICHLIFLPIQANIPTDVVKFLK